jgi:hypothetical protein
MPALPARAKGWGLRLYAAASLFENPWLDADNPTIGRFRNTVTAIAFLL